MAETTIYTIGHGRKKTEDFLRELKAFGIQYLMDVRSKPFSRWNPQFNRNQLELTLHENGIRYVFAGDSLGGRPEDRGFYDAEGKVRYDLLKEQEFFKAGLQRLIDASAKKIPLAIMCSETKPEMCHRCRLIGQELLKHHISVQHIVSDKLVKSQETVMLEANKGKGGELFDF
ncbi:MAG: hypothetical protein K0R65_1165 [Crocinitomicaceae bacterium]|jgi:uncharacterized protein (DUF488 family)|nr:hypothetical protein [Crocinitomicaceae bacterium]